MPSFFIVFNICLYSHFAFLSEAKEMWFDSTEALIQFDNFVENKFHYLAVPNKIGTIKVREFDDCALECLTTSTCLSLNIASASDEGGIFWCELLFSDMFNNSHSFRENASSHHVSKWTPCLRKPCQNGSSCIANYDDDSYRCLCASGAYTGKHCETPACNLTDGWTWFNNSCYKFAQTKTTWQTAEAHCNSLSSHLATIHSEEENNFVHSLISASGELTWLGGNDIVTNGNWLWANGEIWGKYTAWSSGEPNGGAREQCLMMYHTGSGKWNDSPCSRSYFSVCKKRSLV